MNATATPDAPEMTEEQATTGPTDTPPAKSWAAYSFNPTAVSPEPQCHIYGYDQSGNPLDEQAARDLGAALSDGHSTIMVLPNENAPAVAPQG